MLTAVRKIFLRCRLEKMVGSIFFILSKHVDLKINGSFGFWHHVLFTGGRRGNYRGKGVEEGVGLTVEASSTFNVEIRIVWTRWKLV